MERAELVSAEFGEKSLIRLGKGSKVRKPYNLEISWHRTDKSGPNDLSFDSDQDYI